MSEKKPIGFDANQIPMNSMLGGMAFQSFDNVKISGGKIPDSMLPVSTFLKNSAQVLTNKLTTSSSTTARAPLSIPEGDTPLSLIDGDIYTSSGSIYARVGGALTQLNSPSKYIDGFEVLIVAGGGGGGYNANNGGGAAGGGGGGAQILKLSPTYNQQFNVVVGNGGSGGSFTSTYQGILYVGQNGFNTSFGQYVSIGGGGGASSRTDVSHSGLDGGSGGGDDSSSTSAGRGTDGQGTNGIFDNPNAGGSLTSSGNGTVFFGKTYAAGGTAGLEPAAQWRQVRQVGYDNPGSGGVGGPLSSTTSSSPGFDGRKGVVIVAYPGGQRATGGTITTSDGFTFHTFSSNGTFAWLSGPDSYDAPDLIGEAIVGITKIKE